MVFTQQLITSCNHSLWLEEQNQMTMTEKEKACDVYAKRVAKLFSVDEKDIFKKKKTQDITDARQLLYYLCSKRPMRTVAIQRYMKSRGYDIGHSSIRWGLASVKRKIEYDRDYQSVIEKLS